MLLHLLFIAFNLTLASHKNVLMLIADDLRPNVGPYQDVNDFTSPAMVTPNIDDLASKSLVLTRAYSQVALCGPSRNSFLTGRRADTIRCYVSNDKFRENGLDDLVTLPQFFKNNGYVSLGVGKIFHPGIPNTNKGDDYPKSWSEQIHHTPTTDNGTISWKAYTKEEMEAMETPLRDVANADYAIEKLRELAPDAILGIQPFFLAFGVHKPHMPWDFPEEFLDLYPEDSIELPANPYIPEDLPPNSAWTRFTGLLNFEDCSAEGTGIPNIGELNITYPEDKIKELRRAYYASISFADQQLGRVIDELYSLGLADNTVILFMGDHGLHIGEHAEWDKYTNYEIAHRAPLMLHVPGVTDVGEVSSSLVEFVDIYPTLVEAAGFGKMEKCPEYSRNVSFCREGSSLIELLESPGSWKDTIFWQQPRGYWSEWQKGYQGYTVRTDQYRYSEYVNLLNPAEEDQAPDWSSPEEFGELYDLLADPHETVNLYRNNDYHDVKVGLRKILYKGWTDYN